MFGYLNLNDPTKIGDQESQTATNVRVDRGYLELSAWPVVQTTNRIAKDQENREIYIDATFPDAGTLKRRLSTNSTARLGTFNELFASAAWAPGTASGSKPKFNAAATTDNIKYYAITCYDPDTNEESWPYFWEHDGASTFEIEALPGIKTLHPTKVNAVWRVYRRPLGGSEYLYVPLTAMPAYEDQIGNRSDGTPDNQLGTPLNSVDTYPPEMFGTSGLMTNVLVHNRRLWFVRSSPTAVTGTVEIPAGYMLFFSKTNIFGEVPINNYFAFESQITNIFSIDEELLVLTKEGVFVIYGDDENTFTVKEITSSKIGAACLYSAEAIGNMVMFVSSNKTTRTTTESIFLVAGNQVRRISNNIQSLVTSASASAPLGTAVVEDRFVLVRLYPITFVYDIEANGFVIAGAIATSGLYKTKAFGSPGWWTAARRMFVRGLGSFTVVFYSDGVQVDSLAITISGTIPQTYDFTVPPFRANYFEVEFIIQPGAKIYEFGRKE